MTGLLEREPRSILIVRLSAIGDVVMAAPLARALRSRYPRARIAWLAQSEVAELLELDPALDEVMIWPRRRWGELWRTRRWLTLGRELRAFVGRLRGLRADLALDLQGLLKSAVWVRLSGAGTRIGLGSREGSAWLMTRVLPRGGDPSRISSEYLFLAEALGCAADNFRMDVPFSEDDEATANDLIRAKRLENGYVVFCPFTTRPQKHWFEDRWARLARRVREELGLRALLLGGPGDADAAERMMKMAGGELANATGATRLREAAAVIKQSRLLLGVDSGLTHMGVALGVPTLALFGSTLPYSDTARDNARVLYHPLPCSPCKRRPTCGDDFTCMREIEEDEVMAAARGLLAVAPE